MVKEEEEEKDKLFSLLWVRITSSSSNACFSSGFSQTTCAFVSPSPVKSYHCCPFTMHLAFLALLPCLSFADCEVFSPCVKLEPGHFLHSNLLIVIFLYSGHTASLTGSESLGSHKGKQWQSHFRASWNSQYIVKEENGMGFFLCLISLKTKTKQKETFVSLEIHTKVCFLFSCCGVGPRDIASVSLSE